MGKTKISWPDDTWNVFGGCSRVSSECERCYAETMAGTRLAHLESWKGLTRPTANGPRWTGMVRLMANRLLEPLGWRKPRRVFVCSMSDLFHETIPLETLAAVFGVFALAPRHVFITLTKRPERQREFMAWVQAEAIRRGASPVQVCIDRLEALCAHVNRGFNPFSTTPAAPSVHGVLSHTWRRRIAGAMEGMDGQPPVWPLRNVWAGVTVGTNESMAARVPVLLDTPAHVRWLSMEPLLEAVNLSDRAMGVERGYIKRDTMMFEAGAGCLMRRTNAPRVDWVVVGGESGKGARVMRLKWARAIRDQCRAVEIPFHFKQIGSGGAFLGRGAGGRLEDIPPDLRVREYPPAPWYEAKQDA